MKAIVWQGGMHFRPEEAAKPTPGPNQVLVRIEATSVCTSDFHLQDLGVEHPLIPGHEAAGIIDEVSGDVTSLHVGDRVTLNPVQSCGRCYCCTHGMRHLCLDCRHLGYKGVEGTWAEYVAVDAANAYRIPDDMSFAVASLMEPTAVCYQSFERARLCNEDRVLIIGDGPFGFLHAAIARARGAAHILLAGHHDERLRRIAEATGAETCNTGQEPLEQALARTVAEPGADIVIEATGAGAAVSMGLQALRPRGTMVIFSYVWEPQVLDLAAIHVNELNIRGSCRSLDCFEPCLELIREGKIDPGALLSREFSLDEPEKARLFLRDNKPNVFKVAFTRG